jgi:pyruvate dehydrogenase E1 component alpha subunit
MSNLAPTADEIRALHERMLLIRRAEERLGDDFHAGRLPGNVHLYIGQEAVAAGVCAHLDDSDWITGTHRGHGHFLAKGGDPGAMMAEVYGRAEGICGGFGGSMHVADLSKGILGANGIVGGGMAIATGAALAAKLDGAGRVAAGFFGDGAANQGVLMECMNVSALWQLPMIFVCEHNGFSEFSPSATVTAGEIGERARPFAIPIAKVDGNDAVAVWTAAAEAIARARDGGGPSFIEAQTYRIRGHLEAEAAFIADPYRTEEEIESWRARDPIDRLAAHMLAEGICDEAWIAETEAATHRRIAEAAAFAEAGAPPDPARIRDMMFVDQAP